MAERPEDLNLPISVVQRIIKESLPDGVIVSKEARQSISRASSVFVLYLTACAVTHANKAKRKTLTINDILAAISDMEFDSFIEPLKDALKSRKESIAQGAASKKAAAVAKAMSEENQEAIDENEEDDNVRNEQDTASAANDEEKEGVEEENDVEEGQEGPFALNMSSALHKNKKQKINGAENECNENYQGSGENENEDDSDKSSDEDEEK